MSISPIQTYLKKVAAGDDSYREKLCNQLAERLVYVPSLSTMQANFGKTTRVSVVRFKDGEKDLVPIFTSERAFDAWRTSNSYPGGSFSLICADLCMALEPQSWIKIDPGTEVEVTLAPEQVDQIAQTGLDQAEEPPPPPPSREEQLMIERHPEAVTATIISRASILVGDPEGEK